MPKFNRTYFAWASFGYLMTVFALAAFVPMVDAGFGLRLLRWVGITIIPFFLYFSWVAKFMAPLIEQARDQIQAIFRGISGALLFVVLVAATIGIANHLMNLGNQPFDLGNFLVALAFNVLLSVFVGIAWALIPSIIIGGAMGCAIFAKKERQAGEA